MTLDDFLRTLETLVDERETTDDDPGQGNFGCEDCRKCNHCRFCVACDSCQDCTYCEESIECTSCTQSKRCVSCEKVSYCEDCRDCTASRYLTLCVSCNDCVHCLGCVGLEGAEFYVLNEKRTRKEYFALLRQVQELMRERMGAGWRPPGIGLASDIDDPLVAGRNAELTAAPWLEPSAPAPVQRFARDPRRDELAARDDYERERPGVGRRELAREPVREPVREPSPRGAREPRQDAREPERSRWREFDSDAPRRAHEQPTRPFNARRRSAEDDWDDRPITREIEWEDSREQTVARPRRPGEREPEPAPIDHFDHFDHVDHVDHVEDDDPFDDRVPDQREREPSSPWVDEEAQAQAQRRAQPGTLRRAGRPKRKPEAPRESTGSASYRTGSVPARTGSDESRTGTGLRLGRKPKRR